MSRNKHPEETVNLILDVAFRLFMEKGFEYTSIQDIINNLGGLSKGAIYHHFKSKEDILVAVTERMTAESNQMLAAIRDRTDLSGKEKLKTIFKESIQRPVQNDIFTAAPNFSAKLYRSDHSARHFRRLYSDRSSRTAGRTDPARCKCLDEPHDIRQF